MKPIKFKEMTKELQKPEGMTDKECGPLPVFNDGKYCISCWKASFIERVNILFIGKVWIWIHSGVTQPPISIDTKFPFIHNKVKNGK